MKINKLLVSTLLASVLLLGACGDDDKSSSSPSKGEPTSGAVTSADGGVTSKEGSQASSQASKQSDPSSTSSSGSSTAVDRDSLMPLNMLETIVGHRVYFAYHPTQSLSENAFDQSHTVMYITDGTYSYAYENYERLWINIGDFSYSYGKQKNGTWLSLGTPIDHISLVESRAKETMMQFVDYIDYTSKASVTYINRSCTKYTLEINDGDKTKGQFYELFSETIIDNATGLALRHYSKQSGTDTSKFRNLPLSFEVTALDFSENVQTFKSTIEQRIGISDWDSAYFTEMGLSSTTRPNATFWGAEKYNGDDEDDFDKRYEVNFHQYSTLDEAKALARSISENLFNAGLKYDEKGHLQSSLDDIFYQGDDGDSSFVAYTANGNYVEAWFNYISASTKPYLEISFDFYIVK